jgi:hypothetical protein
MYTGTIINDLMATVERAERHTEQKRIADERELKRIYELQVPLARNQQIFVGAA